MNNFGNCLADKHKNRFYEEITTLLSVFDDILF